MSDRPRPAPGRSWRSASRSCCSPTCRPLVRTARGRGRPASGDVRHDSWCLTPRRMPPVCAPGLRDTDTKAGLALLGVTLTGRGALAVGFSRVGEDDDFGQRRPAAMFRAGDDVVAGADLQPRQRGRARGRDRGDGGTAWAVGFTTIVRRRPCRWRCAGTAVRWGLDRPRPNAALTSILTDVAMVGACPFAVGYRMTADGGSQPVAARRDGRRWSYVSPRTGKRESVSLTGVAPDRRGGLWVVGYGGPGTELGPVIYRRDDGRWSRLQAPHLRGEAVLADVVASAADDAWAVGYQHVGGSTLPLVLRWDGRTWRRVEAPDFGSDEVVLTAVAAPASGGIWVVGAAWVLGAGEPRGRRRLVGRTSLERGRGPEGGTRAARRHRLARHGWLGRRPIRTALAHGTRLPAGPVRRSSGAAGRALSRRPPTSWPARGPARSPERWRGPGRTTRDRQRPPRTWRPAGAARTAQGQGRARAKATRKRGPHRPAHRRAGRTHRGARRGRAGRPRRADGHVRCRRRRLRRRRRRRPLHRAARTAGRLAAQP